jgi:hypothetical protein
MGTVHRGKMDSLLFCKCRDILKCRRKNLAGAAYLDFIVPFHAISAAADGAVDKPAEGSGVKLPGWAFRFHVIRTVFHDPAGVTGKKGRMLLDGQKHDLPGGMGGDGPPALFIAPDGFYGNSQQLRHFLLGLVQVFSKINKFPAFHFTRPLMFVLINSYIYHTVVFICQEKLMSVLSNRLLMFLKPVDKSVLITVG